MKLYLLNSLITPFEGKLEEIAMFLVQKIDKKKYESILRMAKKYGFEIKSAIGHEDTLEFIKKIFPDDIIKDIPFERINIYFEEGDMALAVRVKTRGEKMKTLSIDDLLKFFKNDEIEFYFISRVNKPEAFFDVNSIQIID